MFFFPYIGFSVFPTIDHLGMDSGFDSAYGSNRVSPHHDFNVQNSKLIYTSGLREWASKVFRVVLYDVRKFSALLFNIPKFSTLLFNIPKPSALLSNIPDFSDLLYNFPKLSAPLYNIPKFAPLLCNIPISKRNLTFMCYLLYQKLDVIKIGTINVK